MSELQRCCPLCGRDNADQPDSPFSQPDWHLKTCRDCGFVYLQNALSYEALEEDQAWTKTAPQEARRRAASRRFTGWFRQKFKRARRKLFPRTKGKKLARRFVRRGKVLDVGCGGGGLLRQLGDTLVPFGIEIDAQAAAATNAFAATRGGRVLQADAMTGLASFEAGTFDGVTMTAYLEHEVRPLEVLRAVGRVLRDEGVAILMVPNYACWNRRLQGAGWPGFRFPEHVNYFTPTTIRQLIDRAGLQVARFNLLDRLPTSDNLWLVARKAA